MGKYKMNWEKLLSEKSQRDRKNIKIFENKNLFSDENKYTFKDLRSEFEKDYHRVLSSPSFRRLQDKTQVFPLEKNDFVRTRLTHSIEVSSFAKSLGQSIADEILKTKKHKNFKNKDAVAITNILASAGLLHDIGNPPFGHFGEDTIRAWFKNNLDTLILKDENGDKKKLSEILTDQMKADLINFEGNAQAIRVVSKLHLLVDENGMNLTYALLNTLIKYPVSSLDINPSNDDIKYKKMGYNLAEEDLFKAIVENTGTFDKKTGECYRHPLTFILEAADDIAYSTADIEDGIKKGFIDFEKFLETIKNKIPGDRDLYEKLLENKKHAIENKYDSPNLYAVQRWIVSKVQGRFIKDVVENFMTNYDQIMNGEYKKDLFSGTESEYILKVLKKTALTNVFKSKAISKMEITSNNMINFLLDNFIPSVLYYDTDYKDDIKGIEKRYLKIISETYTHIYKHYAKEYVEKINESEMNENEKKQKIYRYKLYLRLLLVTDYISGMTDSYIKTLYQELMAID